MKQAINEARQAINAADFNLRKAISQPANQGEYVKAAAEAIKAAADAVKPKPAKAPAKPAAKAKAAPKKAKK